MSNYIRVLGIAPYEKMKSLMVSVAQAYPQIHLTVFVGDRDSGLEIARQNFHGNYDVVISRGGTANMLRKGLALPVVEIHVSPYDLLLSLQLAGGLEDHIAIVCDENISISAHRLKQLIHLDADIYTYNQEHDAKAAISELDPREYKSLLCDNTSCVAAQAAGLNAYMIDSSIENVRQAFDTAVLLSSSQSRLRDENLFLRELLDKQIGNTIIMDDDGGLYLSTLDVLTPELLEMFRKELPESKATLERRVVRMVSRRMYIIRSRRISQGNAAYTAFFFDVRKTPPGLNHAGIHFSTRPEVEARYSSSIFSLSGVPADLQPEIDRVTKSNTPLLISGELGTGKESVADLIYLHSALANGPLICVNCSVLGEKEWHFLLEHHSSPLADEGSTIYFTNIDVVPRERCRQLISTLSDMQTSVRNRVIFSCICSEGESITNTGHEIIDSLCCMTLYLPPLRKISERIPKIFHAYLNKSTLELPAHFVGIGPAALNMLKEYSWPHNYAQFQRVANDLIASVSGQYITSESVRKILRRERSIGALSSNEEFSGMHLDINRPLEEINRDIARITLKRTQGNNTAAAKQLGISRTTLWRLLQE